MTSSLVIPAAFCGPPRSGNGGYVAGSLAALVPGGPDGTVEVNLRRPPALDVPLDVVAAEGGVEMYDAAGEVVASARPVDRELDPVEPVTPEEAEAAAAAFPGRESHPFPGCYVCGTEREDGLRIFPGPIAPSPAGAARMAAPWRPAAELAHGVEKDRVPRTAYASAWAALDCIGGWVGDLRDRVMVLGRMTARFDTRPAVGELHVITALAMSQEGRKTATAATMWDADGRVVGTARHLWITVDPALFGDARADRDGTLSRA